MTWSIIARDKATGHFGIAVATKFFAVGARVPYIAAGIGAIATQALINPFYGVNGLRLLREGLPADQVVASVIAADAGREHRQLHVMDAKGNVAAHIGAACIDWKGHIQGDGFSIAGNMLAGPQVLDETAAAYLDECCPAVSPPPDRRDAGGRSGRRRQARQAIGGLAHLRRGGLAGSRFARRRSRRPARRARHGSNA